MWLELPPPLKLFQFLVEDISKDPPIGWVWRDGFLIGDDSRVEMVVLELTVWLPFFNNVLLYPGRRIVVFLRGT